jgi:hypothetical protein
MLYSILNPCSASAVGNNPPFVSKLANTIAKMHVLITTTISTIIFLIRSTLFGLSLVLIQLLLPSGTSIKFETSEN